MLKKQSIRHRLNNINQKIKSLNDLKESIKRDYIKERIKNSNYEKEIFYNKQIDFKGGSTGYSFIEYIANEVIPFCHIIRLEKINSEKYKVYFIDYSNEQIRDTYAYKTEIDIQQYQDNVIVFFNTLKLTYIL